MKHRYRFVCLMYAALITSSAGGVVRGEAISPAQKDDSTTAWRVQRGLDEMWLISTRHLGCPCWRKGEPPEDLLVQRRHADGTWSEVGLDEFLASDPGLRTLIYVHGNRVDWDDAIQRGWQAYEALLNDDNTAPVRFVIWSWPSDQIHGQLRDVRVKAARTNGEAQYLAWLMARLDVSTPVSLLGYSYGARVATGALHLRAGGELAGCELPAAEQRPLAPARVVLMAAAVHNWWLQPGGCHAEALSQVDELLIQYNSCDPVLKRYRFVEKRAKPAALGYTGMYVGSDMQTMIEQADVCCLVGRSHAESRYFASWEIVSEARRVLLD